MLDITDSLSGMAMQSPPPAAEGSRSPQVRDPLQFSPSPSAKSQHRESPDERGDKSLPPNSSEEAATRQPHQDLNNSASSDEPPSSMQNQQHPSPEFPPGRQHQLPPHPPTSHEAAAEAEPVKVFIKAEPEKVETTTALGIKKTHVQYVIRVDSSIPGMIANGVEVRRRFSDFDALHKILKHEYEGFFLPPLPEKSYIDGRIARESFLRLRRADLQAFLKGIASHPVLRECQAVSTFLLSPGELALNPAWTYLLRPPPSTSQQGAAGLAEAPSSIVAGFDTMVNWMSKVAQQPPKPRHEMSGEEVQLRQAGESLKELHTMLSASSEVARSLCGRYEDISSELSKLGRDFSTLARFDENMMTKVGQYTEAGVSAGNRANDLQKVAFSNNKQHATWKTMSLRTAASLVTLHDYATLLPEALAALEAREAALAHTWELEDDLAFKQHQLTQLNSEPGHEEKKARLTNGIKHLEAQIKASHDRYLLLQQRNQAELRRVNLEREADFRRMLLQYAKCQASLVQQSADLWADLVQSLE